MTKEIIEIVKRFRFFYIAAIIFVGILPYPILEEHRLIILSFGSVSGLALYFPTWIDGILKVYEKFFITFLLCVLTSGLWAQNISLMWYPFFLWCNLFIWCFLAKEIRMNCKVELLARMFFYSSTFIFFLVCVLIISKRCLGYVLLPGGYNEHYLSVLLISCSPFIMFYRSRFIGVFSRMLLVLTVVLVSFLTKSKGSLLVILILLLLYFSVVIKSVKIAIAFIATKKCFILLLLSAVLACLFVVGYDLITIDRNDLARVFDYKEAFRLLITSNFLGVGAGNWFGEAFNVDMSAILGINGNSFSRTVAHSLYALLVAELGIVGIGLYCITLYFALRNSFLYYHKMHDFYKACFYCICSCLIANLFYLSSFSYEGFFSGVQFLAFICIGILNCFNPISQDQDVR